MGKAARNRAKRKAEAARELVRGCCLQKLLGRSRGPAAAARAAVTSTRSRAWLRWRSSYVEMAETPGFGAGFAPICRS